MLRHWGCCTLCPGLNVLQYHKLRFEHFERSRSVPTVSKSFLMMFVHLKATSSCPVASRSIAIRGTAYQHTARVIGPSVHDMTSTTNQRTQWPQQNRKHVYDLSSIFFCVFLLARLHVKCSRRDSKVCVSILMTLGKKSSHLRSITFWDVTSNSLVTVYWRFCVT
jgi:hypothetical protein